MRLAHSPVNLVIFTIFTALFILRKWRPSEAAVFGAWFTTGTNIILRVIHNCPDWFRKQHDLMPVILGTLPLVLGIHFLELLGWKRQP
jgi:hypothetical protein